MARKHVYEFGNTAFLQGAGAAVVMTEDVGFLEDKKFTVTTVIPAKGSTVAKKEIDFVPFAPFGSGAISQFSFTVNVLDFPNPFYITTFFPLPSYAKSP